MTKYVLDLHGNSRKKEISPDGTKDENVFDIMSGVSIILGVKKSQKNNNKKLAEVYSCDIYGTRLNKFQILDTSNMDDMEWKKLPEDCDIWKTEGVNKNMYNEGFSVSDLFQISSVGIVTGRDAVAISENKENLKTNIISYANSHNFEYEESKVFKIDYRPFDIRYVYYDKKFIERGRWDVMQCFLNKENIGIMLCRQQKIEGFRHVLVHRNTVESSYVSNKTSEIGSSFPLYFYTQQGEKISNLKKEIWNEINKIVGETTPENILDYIYAYLYSPSYREKYKEFLKTDFPRVPFPEIKETFWKLVPLGTKLRNLHLLTDSIVKKPITTYSVVGSNLVEKITYSNKNVYINSDQYFGGVPEIAWNFYIGGYQPAQKYLKDRKGRELTNMEIETYEQIIVSLTETDKIMREIDKIIS